MLDADIEKRMPDKTIQDIIAHNYKRKYKKFGFESNQFQEFMATELEKRSRQSGRYLSLEKINHTTDKLARIQALQPYIKNGTIQFSKRHRTLLEQMKFFPKGNHDDGLDALEMVFKLCQDTQRCGPSLTVFDGRTGEIISSSSDYD
ncbi:MAG: phage terminase large subunit [bacterium]